MAGADRGKPVCFQYRGEKMLEQTASQQETHGPVTRGNQRRAPSGERGGTTR